MFQIQNNLKGSETNGGDIHYDSDVSDTIHITVNSSEEGSINGQTNRTHVDPTVINKIATPSLQGGRSIYGRLSSGYAPSNIKPPQFDNDPFKFNYFLNRLHHYLLMLGIYAAISDPNISATTDMDLYLAIASCLIEHSLDLVSSQAFGQGRKSYKLLNQKYHKELDNNLKINLNPYSHSYSIISLQRN